MFSIRSIGASALCRQLLLLAVVALGISACGVTQKLRPYRIDIRQGNYVTQEMAAQLSPGMTEEQVRFVMGSPLLVDPFHANRWDYIYSFAAGGKPAETRRITLLFKDNKLSSVEGDVIAAIPAAPSAASAPAAQSAPRL
ncbi:outer membrane protein assembly factor BamE [Uliginosibacterium sp. H3]|uniref:Outer membrane protein assembly factor BamE n=1 Tax=Uliginosibacterium silvisoli TaxID=3114758 RepID=A0ABU6K6I2_9RHOO|nr:outer membrane protein assembly factor BamE [Uliginosibacterium sp. H3]